MVRHGIVHFYHTLIFPTTFLSLRHTYWPLLNGRILIALQDFFVISLRSNLKRLIIISLFFHDYNNFSTVKIKCRKTAEKLYN